MGNMSHSALISMFMAKSDECKYEEILHPGGLLAGKVHNISSCMEYRYYNISKYSSSKAGNIWPVYYTK